MSSDTNPHELVAQYRKAKKLATFLYDIGIVDIDIEPTDEARDLMRQAAELASVPSRAVVALAREILQEMNDEVPPNMQKLRALLEADTIFE